MTNIPRGDPLKPQPGRREPGARSVRGPKLAEDLTVTAAAHTLDGHTGSLTKSRLNSTTLVQEGNGVPTHTAERSTQYQDLDTNKVYINADGATTWVEIGTGAAATTFLGLTDTPASYAGQTGKVVAVNGAETALEFIAAAGGGAVDGVEDAEGGDGDARQHHHRVEPLLPRRGHVRSLSWVLRARASRGRGQPREPGPLGGGAHHRRRRAAAGDAGDLRPGRPGGRAPRSAGRPSRTAPSGIRSKRPRPPAGAA